MKFALFYHSLLSDWNHGNAHFLRGVATDLIERGHDVLVYEPENAWSYRQLLGEERGESVLNDFHRVYPKLRARRYVELDLDAELDGVDVVIVHEWNPPELVKRIGEHRAKHDYRLFFHDTHHRSVTAPEEIRAYDLSNYDGVLAYGEVIRQLYLKHRWARRAWTWHEAADVRVFKPLEGVKPDGDLVWIGNWGDDERSAELQEFLIGPIAALRLRAVVHGVRYPERGRQALAEAGVEYRGWLPNFRAPEVFARFRLTVHVPRRPYARQLAGIPTIRPFEALACGIPLVTAPWNDAEHLFTPGRDFLMVHTGTEMREALQELLNNPAQRRDLALHGRETILRRHTCAHRVDELLAIHREMV